VTLDLVDTHAHLDGDAYMEDLDAVLDRAAQAGVRRVVSAGQDAATSAARKTSPAPVESTWRDGMES